MFTNALACMNDNDQRQVYTTQCAPPEEIWENVLAYHCVYINGLFSLSFSIYLAHKTFSHANMGVITTPGARTGNCLV